MDIRPLSPDFAVSPQIDPEDVDLIAQAGFDMIVCNRPDGEVLPPHDSATLRARAEAAGLRFGENPMTPGMMTLEQVEAQRAAAQDGGKVLAYCASGTRSAALWSMAMAGHMPVEDILAATRAAGYQLDGLAPQIEAMAEQVKSDN